MLNKFSVPAYRMYDHQLTNNNIIITIDSHLLFHVLYDGSSRRTNAESTGNIGLKEKVTTGARLFVDLGGEDLP